MVRVRVMMSTHLGLRPTNGGTRARTLQRESCYVGPKDASWPMHSCGNTATKGCSWPNFWAKTASLSRVAAQPARRVPGGSLARRFGRIVASEKRGTEYVIDSGVKRLSSRTKRQCDRTLPGARGCAGRGTRARSSPRRPPAATSARPAASAGL
jgi:hypothetical protein